MIAVVLLLGPAHGETLFVSGTLQDQLMVTESQAPSFQPYKQGVPFGPPRRSMMGDRHVYRLQEVYDLGVEEGAVYLHDENCCTKGYERSDTYKRQMPRGGTQPMVQGPDGRVKPLFDDEAERLKGFQSIGYTSPGSGPEIQPKGDDRVIRIGGRMAGKSDEYIQAVEAMDKLIKEANDDFFKEATDKKEDEQ